MSLVFPESHHLAEGACVCLQPGGWCQVVAHSYCSFCSQPGRWDRAVSKLAFRKTCYVCGCECGWCWGGGESLESSPKEPADPWLVVYRRAGVEGEVGWEVRWSAPRKAPYLTAGGLVSHLHLPYSAFVIFRRSWEKDSCSFCPLCWQGDWGSRGDRFETWWPSRTSKWNFQHVVVCIRHPLLLSILRYSTKAIRKII